MVKSKNQLLAPGKIGSSLTKPCARYKSICRDTLGSIYSDLHNSFNIFDNNGYKFKPCDSIKCKTCPSANKGILDLSANLTFCKVYNCVYKLSCNLCEMAYIGQTSNPLHLRINLHRSNVNKFNASDFNNYNHEYQHFKTHGFQNITIDILAIKPALNERLFIESNYIREQNTTYPYGLNQRVYNKNKPLPLSNNLSPTYTPIYNTLNFNKFKKTLRSKRGSNKSKLPVLTTKQLKNTLSQLESCFNSQFNWRNIRKFIFNIKKKNLSLYFNVFQTLYNNNHFCHIFYDLISARAKFFNINLFAPKSFVNKQNTQFVINFSNSVFNHIKFNSLLNNDNNPFPIKSINISRTFKYPLSLGRRIFNYNTVSKFCNSDVSNPCLCSDSFYKKYVNNEHGHIITGDLSIIRQQSLRKLMSLGTKHRVQNLNSVSSIVKQFLYDIDFFLYKVAIKYNKPIEYFSVWKFNVIANFKQKLNSTYSENHNKAPSNLKKYITQLQNNFVITYVDKAPNNYAIICKSYYQTLLQDTFKTCNLFQKVNTTMDINNKRILKYHKLLNIPHSNFNYPYIVLIPKFHKLPIKFRMVTVGCNAYNNNASKLLLCILNQLQEYSYNLDNLVCIKNSFTLVNKLQQINNVKALKTYDFQDLFNSISVRDLHYVINLIFKEFSSCLVLQRPINEDYFKTLTNFIILNNYIVFDKVIYKQIIGIPQGGCASSILANLYLYFYERQFKNKDAILYRYIDDIIVITLNDVQDIYLPDFYPRNLTLLDNDPVNYSCANFLDIKLEIDTNGYINTDIYDKRRDFPFTVNLFTNFYSCMHLSVYRNILINLNSRINKLCSKQYIGKNVKDLIACAIKLNYPHHFIKTYLNHK